MNLDDPDAGDGTAGSMGLNVGVGLRGAKPDVVGTGDCGMEYILPGQ